MNDLRLQLINDSIVDESLAWGYLAVDCSRVLVLIVVLSEQQHCGGQDGRRRAG